MTPGQRVRQMREALGWSAHDLATACAMREAFLLEIEQDLIEKVHSLTWQKLADHLGVTIGYVLGEEELPPSPNLMDEVPEEYRWFVQTTMRLIITLGTTSLILSLLFAFSAIAELAISFLRARLS